MWRLKLGDQSDRRRRPNESPSFSGFLFRYVEKQQRENKKGFFFVFAYRILIKIDYGKWEISRRFDKFIESDKFHK